MATRLFTFAVLCSTLLFCITLAAWLLAGSIDPQKYFITLSSSFHLSLDAHGSDARLEIFNNANYGPYHGSIIGIAGNPQNPKATAFGDVAGIYYRLFQWPTRPSLWTLSLSLAYFLIPSAALPITYLLRRSRQTYRGFPIEK